MLHRDAVCADCGLGMGEDEDNPLEVDHQIPWSKGGLNNLDNYVARCRFHNRSKKDSLNTDRQTWFDTKWFKPEALKP